MKQFAIIISVLFVLLACNDQASDNQAIHPDSTGMPDAGSAAVDTTSLSGEWFLQPVLPSDTGAGKTPKLVFDLAVNRVAGNTGCNSFTGAFEHTDSTITFNENMIMTKMACPGYNESTFMENLLRANNYRFEEGILILQFNETELSRWARQPAKQPEVNKA